jgi:hypothetical protein
MTKYISIQVLIRETMAIMVVGRS